MASPPPDGWTDRLLDDLWKAPLDERFRQIAIAQGFVSEVTLAQVVQRQETLRKEGRDEGLGSILLQLGYLSPLQFEEILRLLEQGATSSQPPHAILGEGALTAGKYRLLREVGRGGMGVVLEAEDTQLKRRIALKILREAEVGDVVVQRLHREAAIAAQLHHPNIVGIHEVGMFRDSVGKATHFIAMDFIEGRTFQDVLRDPAVPRDEKLRMLRDAARAVAFAHSKGVIHRDLKPANLLVDTQGKVVLTDFGLAAGQGFNTKLTQTQAVMGTPQYMAPEQVAGKTKELDAKTDIWALGVMLYELLTGHPPFFSENMADLWRQILTEDPPSPEQVGQNVPREISAVCLKALEKEPRRRYTTAEEFASELDRFLAGEPVHAHPPSTLYRVWRKLAKRKGMAWMGVAGAAAVLLVAGLMWMWVGKTRTVALEQLQKRTSVALQAALDLRRAGNLSAMDRFARETEEACREAMKQLPDSPEPHYQLGRMYRALLRYEDALAEQERALAQDAKYAPALYEILVMLAHQRRDREMTLLTLLTLGLVPGSPGASASSIEEVLQNDASWMALFARIDTTIPRLLSADPSLLEAGTMEYALGLQARFDGDLRKARELFSEATKRGPHLEEAHEALATLEEDEGHFEEALRLWSVGIQRDRGYLPHRRGSISTYLRWAWYEEGQGNNPEQQYQGVIDDATQALTVFSDHAPFLLLRANAQYRLGFYRQKQKQDPSAFYRAAIEDYDAVSKENDASAVWLDRGVARFSLAEHLFATGPPPVSLYEEAADDLDRALKSHPTYATAWFLRGRTHERLGDLRALQKEDASVDYRVALDSYTKLIELNKASEPVLADATAKCRAYLGLLNK